MYKAIILPLANQDIKEAAHWYNKEQKELGKRFIKDIRSKVSFLCANPTSAAIRYKNTRCVVLDVFPFMVHYTIDEKEKAVIIAGVYHTSLNPERWMER